MNEILDALNEQAAAPAEPYWHNDTQEYYCKSCLEHLFPDAEWGEDYEAWYEFEEDSCLHCEHCGKLLAYTLTESGLKYELEHFESCPWSWGDPSDCYHVARMVEAAPASGYLLRRVKRVLRMGRGVPVDILKAVG